MRYEPTLEGAKTLYRAKMIIRTVKVRALEFPRIFGKNGHDLYSLMTWFPIVSDDEYLKDMIESHK